MITLLVVVSHILTNCSTQRQASLRRAVAEYMQHYHRERNHQGIDNHLIYTPAVVATNQGEVRRRARFGGMLNFYYRAA